jgi:antitoxin CptB
MIDATDQLLDPRGLSRLIWRSRRGMLENDLILERFFERHRDTLTVKQAEGLGALMELGDNDLLDLHLGRRTLNQVDPTLDRSDVVEVLGLLRKYR